MFFYLVPTIQARRPNPGIFSAMLLHLPIGIWAYLAAGSEGALDLATAILSVVIGAAAITSALVLLVIQPRLHYPDVDPGPVLPDPEDRLTGTVS